jgi:hypothetical protein
MTTYKAAIAICGLSQQEAANFHNVSIASVKGWCRGRSAPPIGAWQQLADLFLRIEAAADFASEMIEPEMMDRRAMSNLAADDGPDPLPGDGDLAAGALAIFWALCPAGDEN